MNTTTRLLKLSTFRLSSFFHGHLHTSITHSHTHSPLELPQLHQQQLYPQQLHQHNQTKHASPISWTLRRASPPRGRPGSSFSSLCTANTPGQHQRRRATASCRSGSQPGIGSLWTDGFYRCVSLYYCIYLCLCVCVRVLVALLPCLASCAESAPRQQHHHFHHHINTSNILR
jgi:hypothetical protein